MWGYPRPLSALDLHPLTRWYTLGEDAAFWVYRLEGKGNFLHLCVRPGSSFAFDVRRWLSVVDFLADLSGEVKTYVCVPRKEVASYLTRLGWKPAGRMEAEGGEWVEVFVR